MTQLIDPTDPRYFKVSCDKPYDRHNYELYIKEQEKPVVFEDYDLLRAAWFNTCHLGRLSHVNVVDARQHNKGFG